MGLVSIVRFYFKRFVSIMMDSVLGWIFRVWLVMFKDKIKFYLWIFLNKELNISFKSVRIVYFSVGCL